ncbi:MAG: hypothetical protein CMB89_03330 [Flammeovirgaceae bacterium]|nr:hypothetical protein [Flammeovirgaceae bacterium]
MENLMKSISAVFHPLLMATYSCLIMFLVIPELFAPIRYESIPYFIGVVFVTTCIVPAISILFLRFTQRVSSLEITKLEERSLPFLSIGTFYGVTTYMFYAKMNVPITLLVMMIAVTCMIFLIYLISFKFKISVHSSAIWGVSGLFSALAIKYLTTLNITAIAIIFFAAGLTTTSRLYLGRHTPQESWSGALLGFTLCFLTFYFFG